MKYSILIPLEFHRGVAVDCIRRWVEQAATMPSDTEILVSTSVNHDASELALIQDVLRPDDRLHQHNACHDIPLLHHAARQANGEYLVITESHCAPVDGFLEQANRVFTDHPHWVGFSGLSIPWTHNRLSEIEAAFYNHDIQHQLQHHPWLKVLDQCFVVLRSAYNSIGGLEEDYGHFAEWLLAARFADRGMTIGHDPRPAVHHRYCGDLDELETFTIDFAKGEIRYADHASGVNPGNRFAQPLAWQQRYALDAKCLRQATQSILSDSFRRLLSRDGWRSRNWQSHPWATLRQLLRKQFLAGDARLALQRQIRQLKNRLVEQLNDVSPMAANDTFREWLSLCVQYGYAEYLAEWYSSRRQGNEQEWESHLQADSDLHEGSGVLPLQRLLGFHADEVFESEVFCWLEPLSMFRRLGSESDVGHIVFTWATFASPSIQLQLRFYCNGRSIPDRQIEHTDRSTSIRIEASTRCKSSDTPSSSRNTLTITCIGPRLPASKDIRSLCIPLKNVLWIPHCDSSLQSLRAA
jgi:hypothetical protein